MRRPAMCSSAIHRLMTSDACHRWAPPPSPPLRPGARRLYPSLARDIVQETLATPREAAPPASRCTDFFHPFCKHRAKEHRYEDQLRVGKQQPAELGRSAVPSVVRQSAVACWSINPAPFIQSITDAESNGPATVFRLLMLAEVAIDLRRWPEVGMDASTSRDGWSSIFWRFACRVSALGHMPVDLRGIWSNRRR